MILIIVVHVQGSTIDREASQKEHAKVSPTLKDVDFINSGAALYIAGNDKMKLMSSLTSDTQVRTSRIMSCRSTVALYIFIVPLGSSFSGFSLYFV